MRFDETVRLSVQEVLFGFQGAMIRFCRLLPGRVPVYLCTLRIGIDRAHDKIGEGDGDRRILRGAHEDSQRAVWHDGIIRGELVMPVQEEAHLASHRPDRDFHFGRAAVRSVNSCEGQLKRSARTVEDAVGVDLPVAIQSETIVGDRGGAHEQAVLVRAAAQGEMRRDLGVEVADEQFLVQAGLVDTGRSGQGQAPVADGVCAEIGPEGGVGEIVSVENFSEAGQKVGGGGWR